MAFDVGPVAEPAVHSARTWRSTVVGMSLGLGIVLALSMKWLMSYQIDSAEERRVQQKAVRAAAARCHEQASHAAVSACLKDVEAKSLPPQ
ncbi:general secretion pathway protein GspL [Variovorax paradoxus]|nr:general secretion pathway protein GspL [Variovorax paradoxus]